LRENLPKYSSKYACIINFSPKITNIWPYLIFLLHKYILYAIRLNEFCQILIILEPKLCMQIPACGQGISDCHFSSTYFVIFQIKFCIDVHFENIVEKLIKFSIRKWFLMKWSLNLFKVENNWIFHLFQKVNKISKTNTILAGETQKGPLLPLKADYDPRMSLQFPIIFKGTVTFLW
jgi:hypothetical protein